MKAGSRAAIFIGMRRSRCMFSRTAIQLPEGTPLIYKLQIWELPFAKVPSRLIFAREGKDFITINFVFPREVYNPGARLAHHGAHHGKKRAPAFAIQDRLLRTKRGEIVTHFWNREINLEAGESVQAELAAGDKTTKSPVLTP